jgi:RHS repeat-associated protein
VITGTQDNRYKFSGKRRDSETGLDHSLYRKFHPNLGRWLSADPVRGWPGNPQSQNLYTYVGNHPTNRVDPMGDLAIPKGCQGAIGPMWVPWLDGLTLIDGFDFTSGSVRLLAPMCVDGAWEGGDFGESKEKSCPQDTSACDYYRDLIKNGNSCDQSYGRINLPVCLATARSPFGGSCWRQCVRECLVDKDKNQCKGMT